MKLRIATRNVFRHGGRSALALATVGAGGAGLLLFMAFNASVMASYKMSTVKTRYAYGAVFKEGYRGKARSQPWQEWMDESVLRTLQAKQLFPRVSLMAFVNTLVALGEGVEGEAEGKFFDQMNFIEGGPLHSDDGVLLGRGLATGLGVHAGDEVDLSVRDIHGNMQMESVKVAGVFFTGVPAFDDTGFRCQRKLAAKMLGTDKIEAVYVNVDDWDAFARQVPKGFEAVSFEVLDEIYYKHGVDWLSAQFAVVRAIILLIVFLGIFNVISMTVVERTREIATLRANGESNLEIATSQMLEAATIGVLGAIAGIALGAIIAKFVLASGIMLPAAPGFTRSFRVFLTISPLDALWVLLASALTTVLSACIPIARVLRVPISEALR